MKTLILALFFLSAAVLADRPAVHGMFIFGNEVTYASHLPMYHTPHDYQVIFKFNMQDLPNNQTLEAYYELKAAGKTYFTIAPEVMELPDLIAGTIKSFQADIYDGHFERGAPLIGPAIFNWEEVVFEKRLNPTDPPANPEQYLLFGGEANEYYAVHIIPGAPSFDAIMEINEPFNSKGPIINLPLEVDGPSDVLVGEILGEPLTGAADIQAIFYDEDADLLN